MVTFADWLEYYNNLDVGPFLESLEKMRDFYATLSIDIFKDAVSLPGVSLKYLLRGTLGKRDAPELYVPEREANDSLKTLSLAARVRFSQESMRLVKQRYIRTSTETRACASECLATTPTLYILVPCSKKYPAVKKRL